MHPAGRPANGWTERLGRWERWHAGRCIAIVLADGGVIIDARMPWQIVRGRARSVAVARRQVDRWLQAHRLGPWA